jgi:uncharacterized protein (DUF433 family)
MRIVETDDVLGGKPRLEGRRISVLQIAEMVLDADYDPAEVADQLDVDLADVHLALAYFYDNIEEMDRLERRREELVRDLEVSSMAPDTVEQ